MDRFKLDYDTAAVLVTAAVMGSIGGSAGSMAWGAAFCTVAAGLLVTGVKLLEQYKR